MPVGLLTQTITVRINNGRLVTVTGEGGTAEATAVAGVASVVAPLKPGAANNLGVVAEVYASLGPGHCTYNYTLSTRVDRNGAALRIAQGRADSWLPVVGR